MATDAAHDVEHLLRVAHWAERLAPEGEGRLAVAAALLHDVVNVPKTSPDRARASERSADVARALLPSLGFTDADAALVADAVRDHSFTRGAVPASALGRAVQDADRLEALGVIGTFRCVATGVRFGGTSATPTTRGPRRVRSTTRATRSTTSSRSCCASPRRSIPRRDALRPSGARRSMRELLAAYGEEIGAVFSPRGI